MRFLMHGPQLVVPAKLHGIRKPRTLLQVNATNVMLELLHEASRRRCSVCNERVPWAALGAPCPSCQSGRMQAVPEIELNENRYVQRIRNPDFRPLVSGEHTAQVTGEARIELEEQFKGSLARSPMNVLACSPTLEMGIDVGGLDAVIMRNVPPRPDNYAQRGGRSGRRTRVGAVLSYTRPTPHDGYFFDRPREMIAGEVPAPAIGLANRDVLRRHLNAILFGLIDPPLAGRMAHYIDLQGGRRDENIRAFLNGLSLQSDQAAAMAWDALGEDLLAAADIPSIEALRAEYAKLPPSADALFDRARLQVARLRDAISRWTDQLQGGRQALQAGNLINRLLGLSDRSTNQEGEADDRGAGHPMRRFAEFGILPGYEFPNEPATLRLLGDEHEEEPIAVERRFGIGQYQPEAPVHARGHRWRVRGLDLASPWNPLTGEPTWIYYNCSECELRYDAQEPKCPRCGSEKPGCHHDGLRGFEFGGFLGSRDDSPVLEEEDRYSKAAMVQCHPQRNGQVVARFRLPNNWQLEVRRGEEVRWVNEGTQPSAGEKAAGAPQLLAGSARGFWLCPSCGRTLVYQSEAKSKKGRRKANSGQEADPFGHANTCDRRGQPPRPLALVAKTLATSVRLLAPVPRDIEPGEYLTWGHSLGASIRAGMRHLYMLDGSEIDLQVEPPWQEPRKDRICSIGAITFIDAAVGGTGFLERAARELHLVAARAIDHLKHEGCETACYRCLKSYQNQRHHDLLRWPRIIADLEELRMAAPGPLALLASDPDPVQPWLEAYDAGVGSPLEMAFLRLFELHGMALEKQIPIAEEEGLPALSVADFRVKGSSVLIYVDGASFHRGHRLRRDMLIRNRLRQGKLAWRIVELAAKDLGRGAGLVDEIRALACGA